MTASSKRDAIAGLVRPVNLHVGAERSLVRSGGAGLISVGWQGAVRFIVNAIIGRFGGPVLLGEVGAGISSAQLTSLLWPASTGSAASKFVALARGRADNKSIDAVAAHLAKRVGLATAVLGVALFLCWRFFAGSSVGEAVTIALLFTGYAGQAFTRGLAFGAGQGSRATAWDLLTGLVGLVGVVGLLLVGQRGVSVILPLALGYCLYSVAGWPWHSRGKLPDAPRREIDGFVFLGAVGTLSSAGFLQASMIVAKATSSATDAGEYAAALTLATPVNMLASALSLVLFPSMARAWGGGDFPYFKAATDKATRSLIALMTGIIGVIAVLSPLISRLFWGSQFQKVDRVMPVLLAAVLLGSISVPAVNAITTRSQRGMAISAASSFVGLLTGLGTWSVTTRDGAVLGVAWGYLSGSLLIAGIPFVFTWVRDGHQWAGLVCRFAVLVLIAGGMVTAWQVTQPAVLWSIPLALLYSGIWTVLMHREAGWLVARLRGDIA